MLGNRITAQHFKHISNAIFIAILSYMLFSGSTAIKTIVVGLTAIFDGQCGGSNLIWERIGLGNPVCASYNRVIRVITNSVAGDPTAIATFAALFTITLKSPFLMIDALKIARYQMAKTLPTQIMASEQLELLRQEAHGAVPQIQDAASPEQQRQIENATTPEEEDAVEGLLLLKVFKQYIESEAIIRKSLAKNTKI